MRTETERRRFVNFVTALDVSGLEQEPFPEAEIVVQVTIGSYSRNARKVRLSLTRGQK